MNFVYYLIVYFRIIDIDSLINVRINNDSQYSVMNIVFFRTFLPLIIDLLLYFVLVNKKTIISFILYLLLIVIILPIPYIYILKYFQKIL